MPSDIHGTALPINKACVATFLDSALYPASKPTLSGHIRASLDAARCSRCCATQSAQGGWCERRRLSSQAADEGIEAEKVKRKNKRIRNSSLKMGRKRNRTRPFKGLFLKALN
jgi:hypothetical protein